MTARYWTHRLYRPEDTDAVMELIRAVHGDKYLWINREYWKWRYLNGTEFQADVLLAECEGRPIGIQPLARFDFQWGRDRLAGVMYTGVLTHPEHRRRGVFHSLIDSSNAYAAQRGAQFSMTLPNDASLPGFLKFGDWIYPGMIPLYLKVTDGPALLRPKVGAVLAQLGGWVPALLFRRRRSAEMGDRLDFAAADQVPSEFDEVFEAFCEEVGALMLRRTAAYWNWRYAPRPAAPYRTLIARRDGRLMGAVATSTEQRMGMNVGLIMDVVARGGVPIIRGLIRAAERDLSSRGIGAVTCQATASLLHQALCEEGFVRPNPKRLPKRFHYVFRPSGLPFPSRAPAGLEDWHLSFGDSDNA